MKKLELPNGIVSEEVEEGLLVRQGDEAYVARDWCLTAPVIELVETAMVAASIGTQSCPQSAPKIDPLWHDENWPDAAAITPCSRIGPAGLRSNPLFIARFPWPPMVRHGAISSRSGGWWVKTTVGPSCGVRRALRIAALSCAWRSSMSSRVKQVSGAVRMAR